MELCKAKELAALETREERGLRMERLGIVGAMIVAAAIALLALQYQTKNTPAESKSYNTAPTVPEPEVSEDKVEDEIAYKRLGTTTVIHLPYFENFQRGAG